MGLTADSWSCASTVLVLEGPGLKTATTSLEAFWICPSSILPIYDGLWARRFFELLRPSSALPGGSGWIQCAHDGTWIQSAFDADWRALSDFCFCEIGNISESSEPRFKQAVCSGVFPITRPLETSDGFATLTVSYPESSGAIVVAAKEAAVEQETCAPVVDASTSSARLSIDSSPFCQAQTWEETETKKCDEEV